MEKLGINPSVMLFQIINFGILVFMLNKFLYKPVLKAIKAKRLQLEDIDKEKAQLLKNKESLAKDKETVAKEAQEEKTEILRLARTEAVKAKKEATQKAEIEAKALILKAKKDIEAEKTKLQENYEKEMLAAALAISEKVIGAKADKKSVDEAYKKLGKVKSALWRN